MDKSTTIHQLGQLATALRRQADAPHQNQHARETMIVKIEPFFGDSTRYKQQLALTIKTE